MFSPDQERDSGGKWTAGGAASWVKSQLTASNVKTGIALGIKSALYHLGNLDDPAMEVVEPIVHDMVHNVAQHLQVASGRAREATRAAVVALMLARGAG